jgi:DeoR/GlpR family transcriptional regulator of sugar metabolism
MDIKQIIVKHLSGKPFVTVAQIVSVTGFSRKYVHRFFKQLQEEGKIVLIGKANTAQYVLKKNS